MKTNFIHARVKLAPGLTVVIDGNSKITAGNGSYAEPVPNAFSLPAASVEGPGRDCPGSTSTCRTSCYVRGLANHAPDVYAAYRENAAALGRILHAPAFCTSDLFFDSASELGAWVMKNAPDGFRWHVSGDVWNPTHALWIANVALASRPVRHWIYTRTLDVVDVLSGAPNLAVNVSADEENYSEAFYTAMVHGGRLAYLVDADSSEDGCGAYGVPSSLPDDAIVFPDYPLRGRELAEPTEHPWWNRLPHKRRLQVCPADFFGQSQQHRCGPCTKCLTPSKR